MRSIRQASLRLGRRVRSESALWIVAVSFLVFICAVTIVDPEWTGFYDLILRSLPRRS